MKHTSNKFYLLFLNSKDINANIKSKETKVTKLIFQIAITSFDRYIQQYEINNNKKYTNFKNRMGTKFRIKPNKYEVLNPGNFHGKGAISKKKIFKHKNTFG